MGSCGHTVGSNMREPLFVTTSRPNMPTAKKNLSEKRNFLSIGEDG